MQRVGFGVGNATSEGGYCCREGQLPMPRVQHLLLGWTSPDFTLTFLSVCFAAEGRLSNGLGSLQELKGHFGVQNSPSLRDSYHSGTDPCAGNLFLWMDSFACLLLCTASLF